MGISLADVGRSGAVPDLLNRLRQSRQDVASGKLAEATEIRAQAGEERAQGRFESDQETAGITREGLEQQRNIRAVDLKNAEEKRARDETMIDFDDVVAKDPWMADQLERMGAVTVADDGSKSIRRGAARDVMEKNMKNPEFKQNYVSRARVSAKQQKDQLTAQKTEIEAAAAKSGKPLEQNKDYVAVTKALGEATKQHQTLLVEDTKWQKIKNTLLTSGKHTPASVETYWKSGDANDLKFAESAAAEKDRLKGGKGKGLKAADINAISKLNHQIRGGIFDAQGNFRALDKELQNEKAAADEEAARLLRKGEAGDIAQAVAMANRKLGFDVEDVGSRGAAEPAGGKDLTPELAQDFLKKAGGDKAKARKLAKTAGFNF